MPRPIPNFNQFIGQTRVVRLLRRLTQGAKQLGTPCPSILLKAASGCGKTSLAEAVAVEMGTEIHRLFAGSETRAVDICRMLRQVNHADTVFIDEAHSLHQNAQQILYAALDGHRIPSVTDEGKIVRSEFESISAFTLIAATNEPGQLKAALRNRLVQVEFEPYSEIELKAVAERVARQRGVRITPQAARRIAEVAQGVPRIVYQQLELLRYFNPNQTEFTSEDLLESLSSQGIDERNLFPKQREYLRILARNPNGICPLERISALLGTDLRDVRQTIEPYLINQGLVDPNSTRSRKLTGLGRALVEEFPPAGGEV